MLPDLALRLATILMVAFLAALGTPIAHAQDDETARARALFTEGVELTSAGQLSEAEARFREALTLRDAPSIRYNLASVLFQRGAYPEAQALAEAVVADSTTPADIRRHTTLLVRQIASAAGYARIVLRGTASVDVDGFAIDDLSEEIPLAPGAHVATATLGGEAVAHADIPVVAGEHTTVTLDASAQIAALEEEEPPLFADTAAQQEAPITEQWWFWGGIAATVVGAAIVIGVVAATTPSGVEAPVPGNYQPGVLRF